MTMDDAKKLMEGIRVIPGLDAVSAYHCMQVAIAFVNAETEPLRAELAAEKERCAKITQEYTGWPASDALRVFTIRASNAARPQTEAPDIRPARKFGCPEITCKHPTWCRAESRCTGPANAAPPHVEPSAAESEQYTRGYEAGLYDGRVAEQNSRPFVSRTTEARMLELAREMKKNQWTVQFDRDGEELAALVIDTFGEKK